MPMVPPDPQCKHRCSSPGLFLVLLLLIAAALLGPPAASGATESLSGTYRLESWQALQARGITSFFYLHPGGKFLLAAEWPGNETSRIAGTWQVQGDRLTLRGTARVQTNQGWWTTPFERAYRVERATPLRLAPQPEKNRYGILGWPDAYVFFSAQPAPDLPSHAIATDARAVLETIDALLAAGAP